MVSAVTLSSACNTAAGLRTGLGPTSAGGGVGGFAARLLVAGDLRLLPRSSLSSDVLLSGGVASGGAWMIGTPGGASELDDEPPELWLSDGWATTARPAAMAITAPPISPIARRTLRLTRASRPR